MEISHSSGKSPHCMLGTNATARKLGIDSEPSLINNSEDAAGNVGLESKRSAVNCRSHNGTNLPLDGSHREGQDGSPRTAAHNSNGCTCLQDERLLPHTTCDHLVLPQRHELKADPTTHSNNAKFQTQDRLQGALKPTRNTGEVVASSQLVDKVWNHERRRVERRKDEIDNLLVFAALFSAVLTSFAVNSYQMLQPQSSNQSSQVLLHVSQIMGALALNIGPINSTSPELLRLLQADIASATQTVALSAIVINGLWFSSLVCSLAAASVGITVRQWLNHHDDIPIGFDAQDNVRVWHLRRDGYDNWHVTGLLDFLPILLHISVVLFLAGLVILLYTLNRAVADVIMAQIALLGVFLIFTTIAPVFRQNCPYRSPQSLWMLQLAQSMWFVLYRSIGRPAGLRLWVQAIHQWSSRWHVGYTASWRIYEQQVMQSRPYNLSHIVAADAAIMDDDFLDGFVRPILQDCPDVTEGLRAFESILEHRADRVDGSTSLEWFERNDRNARSVMTLGHISLDMLHKHSMSKTSLSVPVDDASSFHRICRHLHLLLRATPRDQPEVYRRLLQMTMIEEIPRSVKAIIINVINRNDTYFIAEATDIQILIACLSLFQDDGALVQRVWTSVLNLSVHLPADDFGRLCDVMRGPISFTMETFAHGGHFVHIQSILRWCANLAEKRQDAGVLFTNDLLDRLEVLCTKAANWYEPLTESHIRKIREAVNIPRDVSQKP